MENKSFWITKVFNLDMFYKELWMLFIQTSFQPFIKFQTLYMFACFPQYYFTNVTFYLKIKFRYKRSLWGLFVSLHLMVLGTFWLSWASTWWQCIVFFVFSFKQFDLTPGPIFSNDILHIHHMSIVVWWSFLCSHVQWMPRGWSQHWLRTNCSAGKFEM